MISPLIRATRLSHPFFMARVPVLSNPSIKKRWVNIALYRTVLYKFTLLLARTFRIARHISNINRTTRDDLVDAPSTLGNGLL